MVALEKGWRLVFVDKNIDHLVVLTVRWCLVLVLVRSDTCLCLLVPFTVDDTVWWSQCCGICPLFKTALGRARASGSTGARDVGPLP